MSPNTRTRRELGCLANSPALRLPRVGSRFFKVPWAKYGYLKHIDRFQDGDALDAWIADGRRDAALVWIEIDRSRLSGDAAWRPDFGLDPGFERLRSFRFSVDHLLFRFPIAIGREAVTL